MGKPNPAEPLVSQVRLLHCANDDAGNSCGHHQEHHRGHDPAVDDHDEQRKRRQDDSEVDETGTWLVFVLFSHT